MTDEVVCLSRRLRFEDGNALPIGESERARNARQALGDYIDANLFVPGADYPGNPTRDEYVEASLRAMTVPERVFMEIAMTEKARACHEWDYDPIWGAR